ncbi:hypothetical protein [Gilliamella sp. Pas-s25]|uniref:hypothetical protein n=1 Tax=Gilliamella sp. Pas-s25 TaxID=2687310 RepID=UPI00135D3F29|nr:hypothetical protein [Gilliamella sp. Pas-s25]MWP61693.1 hypothetical protein [Gilliamella sp. Pas-s25]
MWELKQLCNDLHLPLGDKFTQDWAYELPDQYRTQTWLDKYLYAYVNSTYSKLQKHILMTLLLDVTNDLLSSGMSASSPKISQVLALLFHNHDDYMDLIDYWSLSDEPIEDCFALTPEIRKLKRRLNNK